MYMLAWTRSHYRYNWQWDYVQKYAEQHHKNLLQVFCFHMAVFSFTSHFSRVTKEPRRLSRGRWADWGTRRSRRPRTRRRRRRSARRRSETRNPGRTESESVFKCCKTGWPSRRPATLWNSSCSRETSSWKCWGGKNITKLLHQVGSLLLSDLFISLEGPALLQDCFLIDSFVAGYWGRKEGRLKSNDAKAVGIHLKCDQSSTMWKDRIKHVYHTKSNMVGKLGDFGKELGIRSDERPESRSPPPPSPVGGKMLHHCLLLPVLLCLIGTNTSTKIPKHQNTKIHKYINTHIQSLVGGKMLHHCLLPLLLCLIGTKISKYQNTKIHKYSC